MKTITLNLTPKATIQIKQVLFVIVFLFLSISQAHADCTVNSSTDLNNDGEITGQELVTWIGNTGCTGTITIPNGIDIILYSTTIIPNTINRIIIQDGAHILWDQNNVDLILAENTAIVIEDTADTDDQTGAIGSTGNNCSNTKRLIIGAIEYSACSGVGNVCVTFSEVIEQGGTIQLDPDFDVISGTGNEVCNEPLDIEIELNGFVDGIPTYSWEQISGPGTITFSPDDSAITTITASVPGDYILRINVRVPLSQDCLNTYVDVYSDIPITFRDGVTASTLSTSPGAGGSCNLLVDFTSNTSNGGPNTTYLWDFGDGGNTSTEANPSHLYATGGTYTVTLTVTDPDGISPCNISSASEQLVISDTPPSITGSVITTIEGCSASDAPIAETTVAALEALGFIISDDATNNVNLIVSSSDNVSGTCPIVISRTYTIEDDCGNQSQATQIINVDDDTPPTISGTIAESTVEGCLATDATAPVNTVAALEALGLSIADACTNDTDLIVTSSDSASGTCPIVVT
ncbi:PKD domain-containing protein, partial [Allotamlana fucoidanivorans]